LFDLDISSILQPLRLLLLWHQPTTQAQLETYLGHITKIHVKNFEKIMPTKTYIHLVRHAQGYHNLSAANQQIRDPKLTPVGEEQCATLCAAFPFHDRITHLVASPMRRTMYTCLLSFPPAIAAGKKIVALPEIQEVSSLPCDMGSTPEDLAAEFDPAQVDLSLVTPSWTDKSPESPWEPEIEKLEERARQARFWLRELGKQSAGETEAHVAVVSHGGFLHFLTQDWEGIDDTRCKFAPPWSSRDD
jgi:broad specificity phosphatase PhoE